MAPLYSKGGGSGGLSALRGVFGGLEVLSLSRVRGGCVGGGGVVHPGGFHAIVVYRGSVMLYGRRFLLDDLELI